MIYKFFLKPLFFLFPPERAHHITTTLFKIVTSIPILNFIIKQSLSVESAKLKRNLFGLEFKNPVGLAAGFDKDGKYFKSMGYLGFGFIEIGTVTPKPQVGNPQPRLFRLPQSEGLINRMGFNNDGVEALVERLKKIKNTNFIIGGNIGKNKVTPNDQAEQDYLICFRALFPYVDYFVVNVSSPNTPGLRELQDKEPLSALLNLLQNENNKQSKPKPILLKIAPDLTHDQLNDIIDIFHETGIAGVIATNTTIERNGINEPVSRIESIGAGGLSGKPVKQRSTEVIKYLSERSQGKIPIIGVGGIQTAEDAIEKLEAGASLVQVYSGMVYEGPAIVKRILKGLIANQ